MPTPDPAVLLVLRIRPFFGHPPCTEIRVAPSGDSYVADVAHDYEDGEPAIRTRVPLDRHQTKVALDRLYRAKVPVLSPHEADGEMIELTVHGDRSRFTLSWSGLGLGHEHRIETFVRWLRQAVPIPDHELTLTADD